MSQIYLTILRVNPPTELSHGFEEVFNIKGKGVCHVKCHEMPDKSDKMNVLSNSWSGDPHHCPSAWGLAHCCVYDVYAWGLGPISMGGEPKALGFRCAPSISNAQGQFINDDCIEHWVVQLATFHCQSRISSLLEIPLPKASRSSRARR